MQTAEMIQAAEWRRADAAFAARSAIGNRKSTARRWRRSVASVDNVCVGHPSSPVVRHDELIESVDNPFALAAHAKAVAMRATLRDMTDAALCKRLGEIMHLEPLAEGETNQSEAVLYLTGDLLPLAERGELEAALLLERSAILRECARRGVDPRQYGVQA